VLNDPHDIEIGPDGHLYVADKFGDRIAVMDAETLELLWTFGDGTLAGAHDISFGPDHDVAEAPDGTIWVGDNQGRRLVNLDQDLKFLREISAAKFGFVGPRYLDIDDFGRLIVADQDAHRILLIDPEGPEGGTLLGVLGDGVPGIGAGKFDDPEGVEEFGGRYYFADSDNNRIVRYSVVMN